MRLADAQALAERLVDLMRPHCERIQIAGSIRRNRPETKDIELVAIPRWGERPGADLFGDPVPVNALHEWAEHESGIRWIKPGTPEVTDWPIQPHGKYWRGLLAGGIKLDLFLAEPQNFGLILLIRTGSASFNRAYVTHALRCGMRSKDGYLWRMDQRLETPTEEAAFLALGLESIPPQGRIDGSSLRKAMPE